MKLVDVVKEGKFDAVVEFLGARPEELEASEVFLFFQQLQLEKLVKLLASLASVGFPYLHV